VTVRRPVVDPNTYRAKSPREPRAQPQARRVPQGGHLDAGRCSAGIPAVEPLPCAPHGPNCVRSLAYAMTSVVADPRSQTKVSMQVDQRVMPGHRMRFGSVLHIDSAKATLTRVGN
jgi:hypothetical protein